MNPEKPDNDRMACCVCSLNLSGLTMTKVILWLIAITIVSFVDRVWHPRPLRWLLPGSEQKATPFSNTAFRSPNTTTFPLDGASSGEVRIILGAGDLTVRGRRTGRTS